MKKLVTTLYVISSILLGSVVIAEAIEAWLAISNIEYLQLANKIALVTGTIILGTATTIIFKKTTQKNRLTYILLLAPWILAATELVIFLFLK